jgi:hypothetical protein
MDTLTSGSVRMTIVIHGVRDSEITPQKSASRLESYDLQIALTVPKAP